MSANTAPVITIDGPSGAGKGTLAARIARRLGWHRLDSGALYRLTALAALKQGVALDDGKQLAPIARHLDIRFDDALDPSRVYLAGEDVSRAIRSEQCGNAASKIAALAAVRDALLDLQRRFRQPPGLVADGRDMGTVVFPHAEVKIFLLANLKERAIRRYNQLMEQGISASLPTLEQEIAERDERDAKRAIAPLKSATDAHRLDTSGLSIDEVENRAFKMVSQQIQARYLQ
ncbi:MAG: (d)CMP kinase [Gammaproteobacteria bacterium]